MEACKAGHLKTVQYLSEKGFKPGSREIYYSIYGKILEILKILYKDCKSSYQSATINYACIVGNLEIVEYLYQQGLKPTNLSWIGDHGSSGLKLFFRSMGYNF